MSKKMSKKCCLGCGIGTIVFVGFICLMWVITAQIRSSIKCSIEEFYVPGLDKAVSGNKTNATGSTTVSFDLRLKNENGYGSGVYYDTINIGLYYIQKNYVGRDLQIPIGYVSIPGFYQEKLDHRLETVQTFGVPWEEARMELSNGSTRNMFQVDLAASTRIKIPLRHSVTTDRLHLVVNVSVNDQGMKRLPGSLRLTSASSPRTNPCSMFVLVLSVLCLIVFNFWF